MFKELKPIADKAKVSIVFETDENDKIDLVVQFILKDSKDKTMNLSPIVMTEDAEDIDNVFAETVLNFVKTASPMIDRIHLLNESIKKAAKQAEEDAKKKPKKTTTRKSTTSSSKTTKKEEPKEEKKDDLFSQPQGTPQPKAEEKPKVEKPKLPTKDKVAPAPPAPTAKSEGQATMTGLLTDAEIEAIEEGLDDKRNAGLDIEPASPTEAFGEPEDYVQKRTDYLIKEFQMEKFGSVYQNTRYNMKVALGKISDLPEDQWSILITQLHADYEVGIQKKVTSVEGVPKNPIESMKKANKQPYIDKLGNTITFDEPAPIIEVEAIVETKQDKWNKLIEKCKLYDIAIGELKVEDHTETQVEELIVWVDSTIKEQDLKPVK